MTMNLRFGEAIMLVIMMNIGHNSCDTTMLEYFSTTDIAFVIWNEQYMNVILACVLIMNYAHDDFHDHFDHANSL